MTLIKDQWKTFENAVQTLAVLASTKLPQEKQEELEGVISAFLLDIAATKGALSSAPPQSELPKIPILESRAALMILLISLVPAPLFWLGEVLMAGSANVMGLGRRRRFGR
jgi:hypothetical protein